MIRHIVAPLRLIKKPKESQRKESMTIKMIKKLAFALALSFGIGMAANAQTVISSTTETYLGAVSYPGGLMERAGLRLNAVTDLRYLRVEVPSFCSGQVFEVGYVSNGTYLTAERVRDNTFAINGGRGMLADGVYLSINGPQSSGCSVLVFKVDAVAPTPPAPTPTPVQEYAYTCLTNAAVAAIPTNVTTPGGTTQGVVYPGQTVIISQPVLPGRLIPNMSFSFDADASMGYFPVSIAVTSTILPIGNCQYAPLYQYVEDPVMRRLNLVRLH
jgi:hypothetical protein